MKNRTCKTCGVELEAEAHRCWFCGAIVGASDTEPSGRTSFIVELVAGAVVGSLSWAMVFAVFGAIAWLAAGELEVLWFCMAFGAFAGALFGAGNAIKDAIVFRVREYDIGDDEAATQPSVGAFAAFASLALGMLVPPFYWLGHALGLLTGLTRSARRRHAPGRAQRASVGAVVMGLITVVFVGVVYLIVDIPPGPQVLTIWELGAMLVPPSMVVGAILGALSANW